MPADLQGALEVRHKCFSAGNGEQKGREVARRYVEEKHPGSACAFLVGSYARAKATFWSDVDIFIVDDRVSSPFLVQTLFHGFPIQASTFNGSTAWRLMDTDYQSGSYYLLAAFAHADHLSGSRELVEALSRRGADLLNAGPPPYGQRQIASCRATLVNQLLKLSKDASRPVSFGTCSKLLETFGRYLQLVAGHWIVGDAPFDPFLKESPDYQKAVGAVATALAGDAVPLISAVADTLAASGEIRWSTDPSAPLPLGA